MTNGNAIHRRPGVHRADKPRRLVAQHANAPLTAAEISGVWSGLHRWALEHALELMDGGWWQILGIHGDAPPDGLPRTLSDDKRGVTALWRYNPAISRTPRAIATPRPAVWTVACRALDGPVGSWMTLGLRCGAFQPSELAGTRCPVLVVWEHEMSPSGVLHAMREAEVPRATRRG